MRPRNFRIGEVSTLRKGTEEFAAKSSMTAPTAWQKVTEDSGNGTKFIEGSRHPRNGRTIAQGAKLKGTVPRKTPTQRSMADTREPILSPKCVKLSNAPTANKPRYEQLATIPKARKSQMRMALRKRGEEITFVVKPKTEISITDPKNSMFIVHRALS